LVWRYALNDICVQVGCCNLQGVRTNPGQIALQVTPVPAVSRATTWECERTIHGHNNWYSTLIHSM